MTKRSKLVDKARDEYCKASVPAGERAKWLKRIGEPLLLVETVTEPPLLFPWSVVTIDRKVTFEAFPTRESGKAFCRNLSLDLDIDLRAEE